MQTYTVSWFSTKYQSKIFSTKEVGTTGFKYEEILISIPTLYYVYILSSYQHSWTFLIYNLCTHTRERERKETDRLRQRDRKTEIENVREVQQLPENIFNSVSSEEHKILVSFLSWHILTSFNFFK